MYQAHTATSETKVLDRDADVPSAPPYGEHAADLPDLIATRIPVETDGLAAREMNAIVAEEDDRAREVWSVFFVSFTLLTLFVVSFAGYLILAAAHLL